MSYIYNGIICYNISENIVLLVIVSCKFLIELTFSSISSFSAKNTQYYTIYYAKFHIEI